jgi:hypothetical protein
MVCMAVPVRPSKEDIALEIDQLDLFQKDMMA